MIAKRAARRKDSKSSFKALARYILDAKRQGEKVLHSSFRNCLSDTLELAIKEIEATQALNTRAKSDKTYHLIVSFRAGERPDRKTLAAIEDALCRAIGLGDHQRLSAVHDDTQNLHIHIAINKIHPQTYRLIEPYYDHYRLSEACRQLEKQYGLQPDNGIPRERRFKPVPGAAEMETHRGLQSFQSWIRKHVLEALDALIREGGDWDTLHRLLAAHNLELRQRGAGLVLCDRDRPLYLKASAVSRSLSKGALEKALGPFVPAGQAIQALTAGKRYEGEPIHAPSPERDTLWPAYQQERNRILMEKRQRLAEIQQDKEQRIEAIVENHRKLKHEVRTSALLKKRQKVRLYRDLDAKKKATLAEIKAQAAEARRSVHQTLPLPSWQDFLKQKAAEGHESALKRLRRSNKAHRRYRHLPKLKSALPASEAAPIILRTVPSRVFADGTVQYHTPKVPVADSPAGIVVPWPAQPDALLPALRIAALQGRPLVIEGPEAFQEAVLRTARDHGIGIRFEAPGVEPKADGESTPAARDPIDAYIAQRNALRSRVSDIPEHVRFTEDLAGQAVYRGQRRLEGITVGLFERHGRMLVLPLSDSQATKLKGMGVGTSIQLDRKGRIHRRELER